MTRMMSTGPALEATRLTTPLDQRIMADHLQVCPRHCRALFFLGHIAVISPSRAPSKPAQRPRLGGPLPYRPARNNAWAEAARLLRSAAVFLVLRKIGRIRSALHPDLGSLRVADCLSLDGRYEELLALAAVPGLAQARSAQIEVRTLGAHHLAQVAV